MGTPNHDSPGGGPGGGFGDGSGVTRLGLVGLGRVACAQIAALRGLDGIRLIAAADPAPAAAAAADLPPGVPLFDGLEALLRAVETDCLLVSVPTPLHAAVAGAVLQAGRACLLEKPACQTRAEFHGLLCQAEERGLFFDVALHFAHAREVTWWADEAAALGLGPPVGFHARFCDDYVQDGKLRPQARALGGAWLDSGINALSVLSRFLDPAALQVVAASGADRGGVQAAVQARAQADFVFPAAGAGRGRIETDWTAGHGRKTTRLLYAPHPDAPGDAVATLDHAAARVTFERAGRPVSARQFAPRRHAQPHGLAAHYLGVFAALPAALQRGTPDGVAAAVHRVFFDALERMPRA